MYLEPEKLLSRINSGKGLELEELENVAELLEFTYSDEVGRKLSIDDVYSYLLVLGRAHAKKYRNLLERYLDVKDPLTTTLVLEILCTDWQGTDEYLERVINFSLGVAWDDDDDIKQTAQKILGEYVNERYAGFLKNKTNAELKERVVNVLELLIDAFENKANDLWTRTSAYSALCRAFGKEWEEIPSFFSERDLDSDKVDMEMLAELRKSIS